MSNKMMHPATESQKEKAPHCTTSERANNEDKTGNLQEVPTTAEAPVQLPPLAADLERQAHAHVSLDGKVHAEEWEFLKLLSLNLRATAERVAALETTVAIPHAPEARQ